MSGTAEPLERSVQLQITSTNDLRLQQDYRMKWAESTLPVKCKLLRCQVLQPYCKIASEMISESLKSQEYTALSHFHFRFRFRFHFRRSWFYHCPCVRASVTSLTATPFNNAQVQSKIRIECKCATKGF